jgi:hypothetical protein
MDKKLDPNPKPVKSDDGWTHGACPFCERQVSVNWDDQALLHEQPMCKDFETRTADQFVQAVLDGMHKN